MEKKYKIVWTATHEETVIFDDECDIESYAYDEVPCFSRSETTAEIAEIKESKVNE